MIYCRNLKEFPHFAVIQSSLAPSIVRIIDTSSNRIVSEPSARSGIEAHNEDHIDKLDVGAVRFKLVKPSTRGRITTTSDGPGREGALGGAGTLWTQGYTGRNDLLDQRRGRGRCGRDDQPGPGRALLS